jgi:hypothetical protein
MDWILDPIDRLQWALWHFLATIFWAIDRLVLIGAVLIHSLRKWITRPEGVIDLVMSSMLQGEQAVSLKTFVAGAILLALLLAAFVFILRPLIGRDHAPVDLRKVFLWLVLAGYLFSTGGAFFSSLEGFRAQLSSSAYQVAASVNSSVSGTGYNNTQGEVPLNSSQPFSPTVQLFPNTTHVYPGSQEFTGIDVASAYLFATQEDVNGTNNGGTGLPAGFEAQYYTNDGASPWPSNYTADQRQAALNKAVTGVIRMGTGIVPSIFACQQAIIFLALALAAAILIFSLPIALVFAFFSATEVITLSVLRAYIALLVKTYVTAMILAIFMGFLKFWADSQNWVAFLGMALLITYFTFQLMHMAVQTITQSLNVVTQAIGQATRTGAVYFDPIKMAGQGMGLAATVGIAAATGGASLAAGSLISGMGEMGAGVPGMRTLGFGLAMKGRKPGQYANDALNKSNGPVAAGGPPLSGPQRANNHLRSIGAQPIQPTAAASPASTPPTQPLPTKSQQPASAVPSGTGAPVTAGTQIGTPQVPATNGSNGSNRSNKSTPRQTGIGTNVNSGKPTGSASDPRQEPLAAAQGAPQAVHQAVEAPQGMAATQQVPEHHKPGLEGFAGLLSLTRVRPVRGLDTAMATAFADLVRSGEGAGLPAQFQGLSRATQDALADIAGRGYQPDEVASIARAVSAVVSRLQLQNLSPTAISRQFLGKDGRLDIESRGVRDVLSDLGERGPVWKSDPQRQADLAYVVGTSLQLERTYHAGDIRAAVGRAVAEGGSADTAADHLEVSPAAWGGRYGSVQSVIAHSPAFGLSSVEDVQRFVTVAQQRSIDDLVSGQATDLGPEQQALLDRVRRMAAEIAASDGDSGSSAAQGVLQRYLRDVRNIPTRVTATVAPVVPQAPVAPQRATPQEETKR